MTPVIWETRGGDKESRGDMESAFLYYLHIYIMIIPREELNHLRWWLGRKNLRWGRNSGKQKQRDWFHSFLWLSNIPLHVCLYHTFFIHSSINGHLDCFLMLAFVNKSDWERQIPYDFKINEQNRNKFIDMENKLMVTRLEGSWVMGQKVERD